MTRAIELNDVDLTLAENGRVLAMSPGYALLEESGPSSAQRRAQWRAYSPPR